MKYIKITDAVFFIIYITNLTAINSLNDSLQESASETPFKTLLISNSEEKLNKNPLKTDRKIRTQTNQLNQSDQLMNQSQNTESKVAQSTNLLMGAKSLADTKSDINDSITNKNLYIFETPESLKETAKPRQRTVATTIRDPLTGLVYIAPKADRNDPSLADEEVYESHLENESDMLKTLQSYLNTNSLEDDQPQVQLNYNKKLLKAVNNQEEDEGLNFQVLPQIDPHKRLSFGIYVFLALSGIYVSFFGFRIFRLLMILLGFYVSYYGILFILTELKMFKSNNIGHQIGLFMSCLVLGFIISILCFLLHRVNFLILGLAMSSMISLFAAQFFIDFKCEEDRVNLLIIYLLAAGWFTLLAFVVIDHLVIWGSAFIGAVITPINLGVIFGDFKSFEDREKLPKDRWKDFLLYIFISGLLFMVGLAIQYYLRKRIIKRMENSENKPKRGTSFLN